MDDVIGMFGEDTCNASGNRLISFLNEVELVVCNGKSMVLGHGCIWQCRSISIKDNVLLPKSLQDL